MTKLTTQLLTILGFIAVFTLATLWRSPAIIAAGVRASLMQNADEPARNPYQEEKAFTLGCSVSGCTQDINFSVVPAGKRLVVTEISAEIQLLSGAQILRVELFNSTPGVSLDAIHIPAVLQFAARGGQTIFTANKHTLLYIDAGSKPAAFVGSSAGSSGNSSMTISGYFVNLP